LLGRGRARQAEENQEQSKLALAAEFFSRLGKGSAGFLMWMMNEEMDPAQVEFMMEMGKRMTRGEMDPGEFQGSLIVLGYLARAYEERIRSGKGVKA